MKDIYVLLVGGCLFVLLLSYWQRKDDQFDLRWLIVDSITGKVSLFKLGQLVALGTSTWVLVYETRQGHLTDWLFLAYIGIWSGVNVANKVADKLVYPVKITEEKKGTVP